MSDFGPETSLQRQLEIKEQELKGEYRPDPLAEGEIRALEAQLAAMEKLLQEEISAKYKLEVQFGKNRTSSGRPFVGVLCAWLSGSKFHGGGDEKIFECADDSCGAFIFPHQITQRTVVHPGGKEEFKSLSYCSECGKIWESHQTTGERFCNLTEQDWAYAILNMLRRLDLDADIYLKYHPTDIRYKAMMEMARNRGGEELALAKKNRGLHIYPLKNLIKDTKHGADLYKQIRKFINA